MKRPDSEAHLYHPNSADPRLTEVDSAAEGVTSIGRYHVAAPGDRLSGGPGLAARPGTDGCPVTRVMLRQGAWFGGHGPRAIGMDCRQLGSGLVEANPGGGLLPV